MAGCEPLLRVGNNVLDSVVFCVGPYGVTVTMLVIMFLLFLLLFWV